jgi:hypothetical protein
MGLQGRNTTAAVRLTTGLPNIRPVRLQVPCLPSQVNGVTSGGSDKPCPPTANPPTPSSPPSYGRIEETCQIRKKEGNECSRSAGARAPRRRASRMSEPCRWHTGKSPLLCAHCTHLLMRKRQTGVFRSSCKYSGSVFGGHPSRRFLSRPSIVRSMDRVVIQPSQTLAGSPSTDRYHRCTRIGVQCESDLSWH